MSLKNSPVESEIVVIGISGSRYNQKKKRAEWLVQWKDGDETWEPLENLKDSDGTINEHLQDFLIK
jgi:hypothetical protein